MPTRDKEMIDIPFPQSEKTKSDSKPTKKVSVYPEGKGFIFNQNCTLKIQQHESFITPSSNVSST